METLLESWDRRRVESPSSLALVSRRENRRLDFRDLEERSRTWRRLLGDDPRPAALAAPNGSAFLEAFLALRRLGVSVLSMDSSGTAASRLELCRRLGVARLIHRPGDLRLPAGQEEPESVALPDGLELLTTGAAAAEPPRGTALIKLTSGSTGDPLAACFADACLATGIRQIAEGMEITSRDRVLLTLPLSHSYGFDNGVLSLLVIGTPLILEPSVFAADIQRTAETYGATFLPLVPPLVRSLAGGGWRAGGLRRVICAGGVLPPEFAAEFRAATGLAVHNFYGSTETGGICFERRPEEPEAAGTVGQPLPGVELSLDAAGRVRVDSAANLIGRLGDSGPASGPLSVATGDLGERTAEGRLR
ncbi:MAG: class I adenylate-forming enzyme family protein, partial [Acidobacteriota bacterium]